jgi:stearoyl-CoA desaturase (delta-9 desaturase)
MFTAVIIFFIGYVISMTYISVFYHRGLAHGGVELPNWLLKFIDKTAMPIIGIDPKGWTCMHRLHHEHSDTELDPHSPVHKGFWYTFILQHKSFERVLVKLIRKDPTYTKVVSDIPFDVHWLNKKGLWYVPFVGNLLVGVLMAIVFDNWLVAPAWFIGISGHPIQGFLVNSFGHYSGYRNFDYPDNSKNNTLVAWFVFGEGYQNNHHQYPNSPKFSLRSFEIDPGWLATSVLDIIGVIKINRQFVPRKVERKLQMIQK